MKAHVPISGLLIHIAIMSEKVLVMHFLICEEAAVKGQTIHRTYKMFLIQSVVSLVK